jgi:hypothetical protein
MATTPNDKDVLYIDIDDDITTIIDKVRSSAGKVVALVLPKRASVFQSIVNMKLLKRSAENAKKHVVLVTTEPTLMPLAGAVGLYVAETAQSKPEIPLSIPVNNPAKASEDEAVSLDDGAEGFTTENAGDKAVGELAGAAGTVPSRPEGIETLTLPDESEMAEDTEESAESMEDKKPAKEKHLKVPNFNKFRVRLLLLGLLVLIIIGLFIALSVLPKATIKIGTNTTDTNVSLTLTLDPSAQSLNLSTLTAPARTEQQQQTTTQQVNTTGQQNNGSSATGQVTMSAGPCSGTQPADIPAGTGISTNGLTYITQGDTTFNPVIQHAQCTWQSSGATDITSQSAGTKYNTNGTVTFTVAGNSNVTATGSASGGTDDIVQVVAQADIDSATQKLATQSTDSIKSALEQQLTQDGLYPLPVTFNAGTPTITSSSPVGSPASTVTVTQAITYTMYGVKQSYLDALIANNVDSQISTTNQTILSDGLSGATITVASSSTSSEQIALVTTAVVGPDIRISDIKKEVAGKKTGDAQSLISQLPGVTSVNVHLSPFWVGAIPSSPSKISVTIGKAT